jgi:hypothetical protein
MTVRLCWHRGEPLTQPMDDLGQLVQPYNPTGATKAVSPRAGAQPPAIRLPPSRVNVLSADRSGGITQRVLTLDARRRLTIPAGLAPALSAFQRRLIILPALDGEPQRAARVAVAPVRGHCGMTRAAGIPAVGSGIDALQILLLHTLAD